MTNVNIPVIKPHTEMQDLMINYPGNVVAFAGRRFGKTDAYVQRLFRSITKTPGLYWWVGLSWRSASMKRAWRETTAIARQILTAMGLDERNHINRSTFEILIPDLGEIWFRSAENPSSLAGEGIRGAIVDEFSLMREIVWTEYLEATLLDYDGWVAFGGVPKGRNWAAHLWGSAASRRGWQQIHATTYDNPYINAASINDIKDNLSERFFKQEYLAQIIDDAGVFRRVLDCAIAEEEEPRPGARYVFGVDWGKFEDFTVITIIDIDKHKMVHLSRFNKIDYTYQSDRLKSLYELYNPIRIQAESNAMGEPIIDQLRREGIPIRPFTTTNQSKATIINSLALAFEQDDIKILADPVLIAELQAFEATRLPSGLLRYAAPEGYHDDTVMSLALAWDAISKPVTITANPFYG